MSIKKIALIFFLGVVAALSIRSLQANPFTSLFNAAFGNMNNTPASPITSPINNLAKETVEIAQETTATVLKKTVESAATNAPEIISKTAEIIAEKGTELAQDAIKAGTKATPASTEYLIQVVKADGAAVLKFLGTQALKSVNYLEGKSNFKISGITVNPVTLTKTSCTFINNHREAFATAAVIFGSLYLYTTYKGWYNKQRESLNAINTLTEEAKNNKKMPEATTIRRAIANAKKYRAWNGFKNRKLINAVKAFFRNDPKLSTQYFDVIHRICLDQI